MDKLKLLQSQYIALCTDIGHQMINIKVKQDSIRDLTNQALAVDKEIGALTNAIVEEAAKNGSERSK